MVGLLFAGVFLTVVVSYVCTEYQLVVYDAWRRVTTGDGSPLLAILAANLTSFLVIMVSALILVFASGSNVYVQAVLVCAGAQALWLGQHLWFYYRDYLRLRYEN